MKRTIIIISIVLSICLAGYLIVYLFTGHYKTESIILENYTAALNQGYYKPAYSAGKHLIIIRETKQKPIISIFDKGVNVDKILCLELNDLSEGEYDAETLRVFYQSFMIKKESYTSFANNPDLKATGLVTIKSKSNNEFMVDYDLMITIQAGGPVEKEFKGSYKCIKTAADSNFKIMAP